VFQIFPENGYEAIFSRVCAALHFVNRKTGKVSAEMTGEASVNATATMATDRQ
jgi:hypothetical protein